MLITEVMKTQAVRNILSGCEKIFTHNRLIKPCLGRKIKELRYKMTNSIFDRVIDRRNTNSLKYDFAAEKGMPEGLLPLWVADMDFQTPEPIRKALADAADFGIYGYSAPKMDYYKIVTKWFSDRFDYAPKREWTVTTPGVVFALAMAVRAFTRPGDGVLIQRPVYYPFTEVIEDNRR